MTPKVSVLMSVYNGASYLRESVDSILKQIFTDFEFIIIDDGSTDQTAKILDGYTDSRIVRIKNEKKIGLAASLNKGIALACGEYIARMDADDISLPERLEKQIHFMQNHPEVDICGSWVQLIGKQTGIIWEYPCTYDEIYATMLFSCAIAHPSVIIRACTIRQHELLYDTHADYTEDYDLWSRALPLVRFANLPEALLQYRLHGANTDDLYANKKHEGRALIYSRFLSRLNIEYTQNDLLFHQKIGTYQYSQDYIFVQNAHSWFEKILSANTRVKLIPSSALEAELGNRWAQICGFSQEKPYHIFLKILTSPLPYKKHTGMTKIMWAFIFLARKLYNYLWGYLKKSLYFLRQW
jgi:glycosyltransferase involved in cell wall biosynthesis